MSNLPEVANNFDEFISKDTVVVDFWSAGCAPCKMLAPILDDVASQLTGVKFGKVDVDKAMDLANRYKVMYIPNVCIFKDGELVDRVIGLHDEEELTEAIKKHL